MLQERFVNDDLAGILLPREHYHPYPVVEDRSAWEGLPTDLKAARIAAGEGYLGYEWPRLPATLFMEFRRDGNRIRYEKPHFERRRALSALVVAECVEGQGRFLDEIINGIWLICEEPFWGIPAHSYGSRFPGAPLPDTAEPIIDLFVGETAGLLAWTHYLLRRPLDAISPIVSDRIRQEMQERVLTPYSLRDDFGWMGLDPALRDRPVNNWNPWCHSNCLTAVLLLEEDSERRVASVAKALCSLDRFLEAYHSDGGCDEGTSYWDRAGGSLFDCLELLYGATDGNIDLYDDPLIANIGRYLYRAYISGDYFVNFADGSAVVTISADLVYRYGRRIDDERLMALGASVFHRRADASGPGRVPESLLRALPALFNHAEIRQYVTEPPYLRDVWLDGIQVLTAREQEGSDRGLYLAAKCGHNAESHNHNDIGQFIVYDNGLPVLIDVGVGTYTAKTFGPNRYDIWTMQSAYHNLPTIGGYQQLPGRDFAARAVVYEADDNHAQLTLDIAASYPPEAGVTSWQRTVYLERGGYKPQVVVADRFQLTQPSEILLHLMTCREPEIDVPGTIRLTADEARPTKATYDATVWEASSERIEIDDARLSPVWSDHLYRVTLRSRTALREGDGTLTISADTDSDA